MQCLLGLSAWLATLLLLLFIGLSQIVNTQEGALVAGLVLCAAGVAVLRSEAGPFWRQCGTAMAFAGELLVIFGISDSTSFTNACLFVLALAVAVVLGTDLILRFLSGLLIAGAAAGLIWRGLSPALVDENLFDALWRFDSARAAFLWLPIAVTGAWGAAVAFSLEPSRCQPARPRAGAAGLGLPAVGAVHGGLAGGISAQQLPAMWAVNPRSAVLVVAGACCRAAAALSVLVAAPPRADGRPAGARRWPC